MFMIHRVLAFRATALSGLLAITLCAAPGASQGGTDMIYLSCPATGPAPQKLCDALQQALVDSGTAHAIRRVAPGAEQPRAAGDLGIALQIDKVSTRHLSGHLKVYPGPHARAVHDPSAGMSVSDAGLERVDYAAFARALLSVSATLRTALNTP
ncbi:MAG: hypothetical protein QNJ09_01790 [Paracoccaceae bacterium]|nr:hypothetical protein [Paracoccaceae bacterium]